MGTFISRTLAGLDMPAIAQIHATTEGGSSVTADGSRQTPKHQGMTCYGDGDASGVLSSAVQLVAFMGDQINYDIHTNIGVRWSGHLGLRYIYNPEVIYGFSSSTDQDLQDKTDALLNGTSFPGVLKDDTYTFEDAIQSPFSFTLLFYNVPRSLCEDADCGYARVIDDLGLVPSTPPPSLPLPEDAAASTAHSYIVDQDTAAYEGIIAATTSATTTNPRRYKAYAFPPIAPRIYRNVNKSDCDTTWNIECFNCATYVLSVGIKLFDTSGFFQQLIPKMAEQNETVCRCYQSGRWVQSGTCTRDYQQLCTYQEPVP
jgi:hypothetical protein